MHSLVVVPELRLPAHDARALLAHESVNNHPPPVNRRLSRGPVVPCPEELLRHMLAHRIAIQDLVRPDESK